MTSKALGEQTSQPTVAQFVTTHWSVVLAAGDAASPDSRQALEKLCRQYWFPLYGFVRREGYSPADSEDLVQDSSSRSCGRVMSDAPIPPGGGFGPSC